MNFTISSSSLLKELSSLNRVIISKLSILDNFLFEITENKLTITASDAETSIITTLPIKTSEKGAMAVPAHILIKTLKHLPEQPLTFSIDKSSYSLTITAANGRYKLACENPIDFPKIQPAPNSNLIELPSQVLKKAIEKTIFATCKNEWRFDLEGVHISMNKGGSTFVATDGHRLARYIRTDIVVPDAHVFTIPKRPLQLLIQLLGSTKKNIAMKVEQNNIYFLLGHIHFITALINKEYPDYENVIPKSNPYKFTTNTASCLKALKIVDIYANKSTHQIKMSPTANSLHIFTDNIDYSNEANMSLPCVYEGEKIEIGFNAKLLIEMFNTISSEEVTIHFNTPKTAVLFFPEDKEKEEDLLLLIMPVAPQESLSNNLAAFG